MSRPSPPLSTSFFLRHLFRSEVCSCSTATFWAGLLLVPPTTLYVRYRVVLSFSHSFCHSPLLGAFDGPAMGCPSFCSIPIFFLFLRNGHVRFLSVSSFHYLLDRSCCEVRPAPFFFLMLYGWKSDEPPDFSLSLRQPLSFISESYPFSVIDFFNPSCAESWFVHPFEYKTTEQPGLFVPLLRGA